MTSSATHTSAPVRVALFAALLAVVFAAAYAVGRAVADPIDTAGPAPTGDTGAVVRDDH